MPATSVTIKKINIMKKYLIIICGLLFACNIFAQETNRQDLQKQVEKDLMSLQKLIDGGFYYNAYEEIYQIMENVSDKSQLEQLFSEIKELKNLSPQKPISECENLKEQMKTGKNIPKETLFFFTIVCNRRVTISNK